MTLMIRYHSGFNLSELLVALGVFGALVTIALPKVMVAVSTHNLEANKQTSFSDLMNIKNMAETSLGTLPMSYGMSQVFNRYSGLNQISNVPPIIGGCLTQGENTYQMPSGVILTSVGQSWKDQNGTADDMCLALNGERSKTFGQDILWVRVYRTGDSEISELTATELPPGALAAIASANPAAASGVKAGGMLLSTWSDYKSIWSYFSDIQGESAGGFAALNGLNDVTQLNGLNGLDLGDGEAGISGDEYLTGKTWYLFDANKNVLELNSAVLYSNVSIAGIPYQTFLQNQAEDLIINYYQNNVGMSYEDAKHYYEDEMDLNQYSDLSFWTINTQDQTWEDKTLSATDLRDWRLFSDVVAALTLSNGSNWWVGNFTNSFASAADAQSFFDKASQQGLVYTDPTTGNEYNLISTYISPIKLSLNGVNAKLNSDDSFAFDIDGQPGNMKPIITTGGLNRNEAWLMTDRNHDGFWYQGITDGRDVFGDHNGQFKHGYQDLAKLYASALVKDEHGKRYIPLKKLSFIEKQQAKVAELTNRNKPFNPNSDLKLVTRDKKIYYASDFVNRIYVDNKYVVEMDKSHRNVIFQRADVRYISGKTVTSADQWFQVGMFLKPRPGHKGKKVL